LRRCTSCRFAFVANPWTDFEAIYSESYYRGQGADPLVDYTGEVDYYSTTIRRYEWQGILDVVGSLIPLSPETHWLDFGCGSGGLVRYAREQIRCDVVGFDQGSIAHVLVHPDVPILDADDLALAQGSFDVVTAIEVLEHLVDPLAELRRIRGLLKPGGLFFYTTGNASPFRQRLLAWRYVIPEIHVSFFEPETLALALRRTGFEPAQTEFLPGHVSIIRFKVLKNLRVKRQHRVERLLPWRWIARVVDARYELTAHPVAWAS
jgi:2-polyprenyl-3-methyl-5-hydroxy-6-metoxy-1,4-benzoquinol methylase